MPTTITLPAPAKDEESSANVCLIAEQEARDCLLRSARNYLAISGHAHATLKGEVAAGFEVEVVVTGLKHEGPDGFARPVPAPLPCL